MQKQGLSEQNAKIKARINLIKLWPGTINVNLMYYLQYSFGVFLMPWLSVQVALVLFSINQKSKQYWHSSLSIKSPSSIGALHHRLRAAIEITQTDTNSFDVKSINICSKADSYSLPQLMSKEPKRKMKLENKKFLKKKESSSGALICPSIRSKPASARKAKTNPGVCEKIAKHQVRITALHEDFLKLRKELADFGNQVKQMKDIMNKDVPASEPTFLLKVLKVIFEKEPTEEIFNKEVQQLVAKYTGNFCVVHEKLALPAVVSRLSVMRTHIQFLDSFAGEYISRNKVRSFSKGRTRRRRSLQVAQEEDQNDCQTLSKDERRNSY